MSNIRTTKYAPMSRVRAFFVAGLAGLLASSASGISLRDGSGVAGEPSVTASAAVHLKVRVSWKSDDFKQRVRKAHAGFIKDVRRDDVAAAKRALKMQARALAELGRDVPNRWLRGVLRRQSNARGR